MGSAAIAPPDVRDVTLALFGGRKTDMAPSDVPEGLCLDEQDGIFLPGEWLSRPCLSRLYNAGKLTPGTSVLYEKTYVQPNDDPLTLALTSDGKLWVEDVGLNPLNPSSVASVAAGLYGQSVSEFGREYIALSDLLHGQGIPLQFDGTNLDRVTQDGPGAPPVVVNSLPPTAAIAGAAPVTVNLLASPNGITGGDIAIIGGLSYFTSIFVQTAAPHGFSIGTKAVIAGSTSTPNLNGTWTVSDVNSLTSFAITFSSRTSFFVAGGNGTVGSVASSGNSLTRVNNTVTALTSSAHNFQVGWQVQISGIANTSLGGGIASISRDGNGNVTVTTTTAHGFPAGATVAIVGVTNPDTSFNGVFPIASVPSPTTFIYQQGGTVEASGAGTGNAQDIWSVTAFIQSTPSPTSFTYQQTSANDATNGTGTATIVGQISPGVHQFVVSFLTRQGAITEPSPPVFFFANGGSQASFSKIPIGPANVVARIISATGAGGGSFFTIPAVPKVAGQIVGASFVIADNTSTAAIVDFNDNTLFDAVAVDQIGNDLFDQVVVGPVLGFFAFASRLVCWGDYNKVENFLNLGFCGGFISGTLTAPLGWSAAGNAGGTLVNGGSWAGGMSWRITGDGTAAQKGLLTQSAYQDAFGNAILEASTLYAARFWAKPGAAGLNGSVTLQLSSASAGFSATVVIAINSLNSTAGGLAPLTNFSASTPAVIPADLLLSVFETNLNNGSTVTLGEIEIVFAAKPYRDNVSRWSYVNNPEAFAQTTGNLGPSDDASPIRCFALLRLSALLETAEGIHGFQDNDSEPDGWNVNQITRSAGALSLKSGDPGKFGTGDSSPDWTFVATKEGVYLFAGSEFWKVSQEISRGSLPISQDPRKTWDDINWAAEHTIVAKNDPSTRRAYFAVPMGNAVTPSGLFVIDYREMDTAAQIAGAAPLHITLQGKMRSSDLTRKWSYWNVAANDLEILIRPGNRRQLFLAGGPNANTAAFGNIYSLNPASLTDDDYGAIAPFYTTYFFTDHETEQALGIGSDMKLVKRIHAFITGVGQVTITPIVNSLYSFMPGLSPRLLVKDTDASNLLRSDLEWTTVGLRGQRIAFRISVTPLPGATDVQLRVQKMIVGMMKDPVAQFRQSGV